MYSMASGLLPRGCRGHTVILLLSGTLDSVWGEGGIKVLSMPGCSKAHPPNIPHPAYWSSAARSVHNTSMFPSCSSCLVSLISLFANLLSRLQRTIIPVPFFVHNLFSYLSPVFPFIQPSQRPNFQTTLCVDHIHCALLEIRLLIIMFNKSYICSDFFLVA